MTKIELTPRKKQVLKAIVRAYLETGEPIGSKILTGLIENAPSSATLRNEMSELSQMGLLEQPHTSAGRIPTNDGLKLYIKNLMPNLEIGKSEKEFIDNAFAGVNDIPEKLPAAAGKIISDLTGLPVITCLITEATTAIKKVEILPISRNSVMLLIITNDGRTRNRILRIGNDFTSDLFERFKHITESKINRKPLNELTLGFMQGLIASLGADSLKLMPLFTAVYETVNEIENTTVDLSGMSRLYNVCGSEETADKIISLVKRRDPIIALLSQIDDQSVVFGADTGYRELSADSIVAAKFNAADKYKGYIAVIGPNRLSYDKVIPSIKYTAEKLAQVITQAQIDMED